MIHEQIATAINGQIHIIMNEGNEITRSVKKIEIGEIYLAFSDDSSSHSDHHSLDVVAQYVNISI